MSAIFDLVARRTALVGILLTGSGTFILVLTVSQWCRNEAETARPRDELEAPRVAVLRRIEAKEQIAAEVAARRLTLAEAVKHFRALNAEDADTRARELALHPRPGESEEEGLCRQVITWVLGRLEANPDEARLMGAVFEEEMRELLGQSLSVATDN
jgi:hypothetical protein